MKRDRSRRIVEKLKKHYGGVKPDLRFGNLYQLTIAVILSAQTTDRQVNQVTPELFRRYPDFPGLAKAKIREVETVVKSTGFYKNKARNIVNLARTVSEERGGLLPSTREELMELPGIGRKSANVILAAGFGKPAFAVDTHILRIGNRLGYIRSDDPTAVEKAFTALLPEEDWILMHLILIRHGRTLCRARRPLCGECPVRNLCDYADNNP